MEKEIKIKNLTLKIEDVRAFMAHLMNKRHIFKLLIILYSLFGICLLVTTITSQDSKFIVQNGSIFSLLIAILLVLLYVIPIREYKNNKALHEIRSYIINKETITVNAESFNSVIKWDIINNISENKKYYFIWQSRNSAHIIPKKILTNEDIIFLEEVKRIRFSKRK